MITSVIRNIHEDALLMNVTCTKKVIQKMQEGYIKNNKKHRIFKKRWEMEEICERKRDI